MKKMVLSLVALIICICIFIAGFKLGGAKIEQEYQVKTSYLDAMNALSNYSLQIDIADAITSKKNSRALCLVHIQASTDINEIRVCQEKSVCSSLIEQEVLKIAPELLGKGELKIKYYKEGELCKPDGE